MSPTFVMTKCCKCNRIKVNANWLNEPRFLSRDTAYKHIYCPSCETTELKALEKYATAVEALEKYAYDETATDQFTPRFEALSPMPA